MTSGSKGEMKVRTAMRSTGGVAISDSSRTPVSASCSVRGIGVADSVSTCTSLFSSFSRSLCLTPKCCSSSTISRPRFLNEIDEPSSACVPTTMSTVPSAMPFLVSASSFGADQPRRLPDLHRQAGEALREGLEVLARQQRRRHDDRHLQALHRRDEGGAQRHLGLAEADIAADQPVHRLAGRQILHDHVDRRLLVVGLLIGEARRELAVEPFRRDQHRRGAHLPLGGDADQRARHVEQPALQPRLARLPGAAAEPVEHGLGRLGAVARQQARCFRPAGTAGRRRHSGFPGSRAARRPPRWSSAR